MLEKIADSSYGQAAQWYAGQWFFTALVLLGLNSEWGLSVSLSFITIAASVITTGRVICYKLWG